MQVMSHLTEPTHPYRRFGWGDLRSLQDAPAEAAIDVRSELAAFHARYYAPNLLTLVVLGQVAAAFARDSRREGDDERDCG